MRFRISLRFLLLLVLVIAVAASFYRRHRIWRRTHVSLRVVDANTLQPIVPFYYRTQSETIWDAGMTPWKEYNGNGELHLKSPEQGLFRISVKSPDVGAGYPFQTTLMTLDSDGQRHFRFDIQEGTELEGRITDASTGQPVSGVDVIAFSQDPMVMEHNQSFATTGPDGRYRIRGVDDRWGVYTFHEKFLVQYAKPNRWMSPGDPDRDLVEFDMRLKPAKTWTVRVRDRHGDPVDDAAIEMVRVRKRSPMTATRQKHAEFLGNGNYQVHDYSPNVVSIEVSSPTHTSERFERRSFLESQSIDAELTPLVDLQISGRVVDRNRQPIQNVSGFVYRDPGEPRDLKQCRFLESSPEANRFQVVAPELGNYQCVILSPGYQPAAKSVVTGTAENDFILDSSFSVSGRVEIPDNAVVNAEDAVSLIPLMSSWIGRSDENQSTKRALTQKASIVNGRFQFDHASRGIHELKIEVPGMRMHKQIVDLTPGMELDNVSLVEGVYLRASAKGKAKNRGPLRCTISDWSNSEIQSLKIDPTGIQSICVTLPTPFLFKFENEPYKSFEPLLNRWISASPGTIVDVGLRKGKLPAVPISILGLEEIDADSLSIRCSPISDTGICPPITRIFTQTMPPDEQIFGMGDGLYRFEITVQARRSLDKLNATFIQDESIDPFNRRIAFELPSGEVNATLTSSPTASGYAHLELLLEKVGQIQPVAIGFGSSIGENEVVVRTVTPGRYRLHARGDEVQHTFSEPFDVYDGIVRIPAIQMTESGPRRDLQLRISLRGLSSAPDRLRLIRYGIEVEHKTLSRMHLESVSLSQLEHGEYTIELVKTDRPGFPPRVVHRQELKLSEDTPDEILIGPTMPRR